MPAPKQYKPFLEHCKNQKVFTMPRKAMLCKEEKPWEKKRFSAKNAKALQTHFLPCSGKEHTVPYRNNIKH
ncbi:MAG: hypothetical protein PHD95_02000 [Candidatus ainarchaeum sp.]|nr:hypothetical protein [Candidatus ainarchaeum sp.]